MAIDSNFITSICTIFAIWLFVWCCCIFCGELGYVCRSCNFCCEMICNMLDLKLKKSRNTSVSCMTLENPLAGRVMNICIEEAKKMEQV